MDYSEKGLLIWSYYTEAAMWLETNINDVVNCDVNWLMRHGDIVNQDLASWFSSYD